MATTLFISDLHLTQSDPATTERFSRFAAGPARTAQKLFMLGDIFDAWVGDDQLAHDLFAKKISDQIGQICAAGTQVFLLTGNRDFMLSEAFTRACGAMLLPTQIVIVEQGERLLLMHGDELCTDDIAYQHMRAAMAQNPAWRAQMMQQPFAVRAAMGAKLRAESEMSKVGKTNEIMDANDAAIAAAFRTFGVTTMIHGHTHRPATHHYDIDGVARTRIVLADWQSAHGYLAHVDGEFSTRAWP